MVNFTHAPWPLMLAICYDSWQLSMERATMNINNYTNDWTAIKLGSTNYLRLTLSKQWWKNLVKYVNFFKSSKEQKTFRWQLQGIILQLVSLTTNFFGFRTHRYTVHQYNLILLQVVPGVLPVYGGPVTVPPLFQECLSIHTDSGSLTDCTIVCAY